MAKLDTLLSAVIATAAISMAGTYAYQTFLQPAVATGRAGPPETRLIRVPESQRQEIGQVGIRVGASRPRVEVTEFSDIECPFCKASHEAVRRVMQAHPGEVGYTFVHYPLPMHRFALPAARAAECARAEGSFIEMIDRLFEQQDSLGTKPWARFAMEVGIGDTAKFTACVDRNGDIPAIRDGLALGKRLQVRATPTVFVNGWRFERTPTPSELEKFVGLILSGKSPLNTRNDAVVVRMDSTVTQ
jgi:predicted DsbA family dithiol-disulfide isomerase